VAQLLENVEMVAQCVWNVLLLLHQQLNHQFKVLQLAHHAHAVLTLENVEMAAQSAKNAQLHQQLQHQLPNLQSKILQQLKYQLKISLVITTQELIMLQHVN